MKALKKLDRKLNWYERIRKKAAITWHQDLFKVTFQPSYWKYKAWWVNNLNIGGTAVKIDKRLKRDGYK